MPQADKVRAIKMAAIRAENFIVFPSVDYKVTGVLDFFISIRYSLPRCERRQYSIIIFENFGASKEVIVLAWYLMRRNVMTATFQESAN